MSHSMRQQLVQARRFDIHNCANQIASLVSQKMIASPDSISSVTYTYDGDCLEVTQGKNTYSIGKRLTGDFFDTFPGIEIEIRSEIKEKPDIDGYYYHTLDKNTDDGLIEVIAYLDNDFLKNVKYDYLKRAIQSILVHEMQHVVQRCYSKIDMAQTHNTSIDHLNDVREIDARVEEVLCGIDDVSNVRMFTSKMTSYLHDYCKRNNMIGVDIAKSVQTHVDFYCEKILSNSQQSSNMQNKTASCTQMPYCVKVASIIV